jgi:hypothetical protein
LKPLEFIPSTQNVPTTPPNSPVRACHLLFVALDRERNILEDFDEQIFASISKTRYDPKYCTVSSIFLFLKEFLTLVTGFPILSVLPQPSLGEANKSRRH